MEISVKAHPRSSQKKIVLKEGIYHVYVHAPPQNGKANREIMELLAQEFGVPKSSIRLRGETSCYKTFFW